MIIAKTPFRISFFGGGTDYPGWFREHGGAVLATSIDKYCYITCRYLPPFFEHKSRIVYSQMETVRSNDDIVHPSVRATLKYMGVDSGVEIHHDADIPARSGMGSSSSFTVGLLHALHALQERMVSKTQLAEEAIYIEQDALKENVGCQDQIMVAHGGFSKIEFLPDGKGYRVSPIIVSSPRFEDLEKHLLLCFTGISRIASTIAKDQVENIGNRKHELLTMRQMVDESISLLSSNNDLSEFGRMLHEGWQLKRSLTSKISNGEIDELYAIARRSGAIGGKLLGAGGGGFMILFAKPEDHQRIKKALNNILFVPFKFENFGSQIISYKPSTDFDMSIRMTNLPHKNARVAVTQS